MPDAPDNPEDYPVQPIYNIQPFDTEKSFYAFTLYRELPPMERSLKIVAEKIDRHVNQVALWSSKYNWQDRVRAWDSALAEAPVIVRDVTAEVFAEHLINQFTEQAILLDDILTMKAKKLQQDLQKGDNVKGSEISHLMNAVEKLDSLKRRAAGLPTGYKHATAEEPDYDQIIYEIRGEDDE
jgi:hypothetical protein